ncbi:MAG: immunity 17 family protein [Tannerellaceae bacterium]|jgi:small neutral amino acid transporter SnatA (MarC family)|nr:immunity 17 family protein [Tannerellaceae bacterium]
MKTSEYMVLVVFVVAGLFSLVSSIGNFDWFFSSRKAAVLVQWLGRTGARFFYGMLGLLLIVSGMAFFLTGYKG